MDSSPALKRQIHFLESQNTLHRQNQEIDLKGGQNGGGESGGQNGRGESGSQNGGGEFGTQNVGEADGGEVGNDVRTPKTSTKKKILY